MSVFLSVAGSRFVFFSGGSDKNKIPADFIPPLPGNQVLSPGYWTMQLVVTELNSSNSSNVMPLEPFYLTRYRTQLDLKKKNGSSNPVVEKR